MSDVNEAEILDEEFRNYMRVARSLEDTLRRPKDHTYCKMLLKKCERLNSSDNLTIKRYTNGFVKYCVNVLNWTSMNQPIPVYDKWYKDAQRNEVKFWLAPNKSYMSVKEMPNGSLAIYCAVATAPEAGWQDGALKLIKDLKMGED